jgi:hypothetical protein
MVWWVLFAMLRRGGGLIENEGGGYTISGYMGRGVIYVYKM